MEGRSRGVFSKKGYDRAHCTCGSKRFPSIRLDKSVPPPHCTRALIEAKFAVLEFEGPAFWFDVGLKTISHFASRIELNQPDQEVEKALYYRASMFGQGVSRSCSWFFWTFEVFSYPFLSPKFRLRVSWGRPKCLKTPSGFLSMPPKNNLGQLSAYPDDPRRRRSLDLFHFLEVDKYETKKS